MNKLYIFLSILLSSINLSAQSIEQFVDKATAYVEQKGISSDYEEYYFDKDYNRIPVSADQIYLKDVLKTLPAPEYWNKAAKSLAQRANAMSDKGKLWFRMKLVEWVVLYMDGNWSELRQQIDQLKASGDADAANEAYLFRNLEDLELSLFQDAKPTEGGQSLVIQAFQKELVAALEGAERRAEALEKMNKPMKEEEAIKLFGNKQNFEAVAAFCKKVDALQNQMAESISELGEENEEALQDQFMELYQDYAMEAIMLQAIDGTDRARLFAMLTKTKSPLYTHYHYVPVVNVPELLGYVDEEEAIALLKKGLFAPLRVSVSTRGKTKELAIDLLLKHVDALKAPQWDLVDPLYKGVEVFEALQEKFEYALNTANKNIDYEIKRAISNYIFSLLAESQSDKAYAALLKWRGVVGEDLKKSNSWYTMRNIARKKKLEEPLWIFYKRVLSQFPEYEIWDQFTRLSAELEKEEEVITFLESFMGSNSELIKAKLTLKAKLADAYVSSNELDRGLSLYHEIFSHKPEGEADAEVVLEAGKKVIQLGLLLEKESLVEKGLELCFSLLKGALSEAYTISHFRDLVQLSMKNDDGERAQALLDMAIQRFERYNSKEAKAWQSSSWREDGAELLHLQAYILRKAKKESAIMTLLDESPYWGVGDLGALLKHDADPGLPTIAFIVADALNHTGKQDLAKSILEAALYVHPGEDDLYEAYLRLLGSKAQLFLSTLMELDPYEERPLIWMAVSKLSEGHLDEAESYAKRAIAIDPSDGEQGKGDRMRVYDVMRQIYKERGDGEKASFFANVLRAIRLSENADDFYSAGLRLRAIKMYKQAIGYFEGAYCIQSRLAVQLAKEGRIEESLLHYRKAYELMPDSFGRVESHCFGCEQAFDGEQAQNIALEVFQKMREERPEKPQIHYLLGYLFSVLEKNQEAYDHFRKAVELDPIYLNAWKKMADLSGDLKLSQSIREDLVLKQLKLDPLSRHSSPDWDLYKDLKQIWIEASKVIPVRVRVYGDKELYSLPASRQFLDKHQTANPRSYGYDDWMHPADIIIREEVIRELEQKLAYLN